MLDKGGDIWRQPSQTQLAQASGVTITGLAIPFRQLEFRNQFLTWVLMDDIKHRKASSPHLRRLFKIANEQAVRSIPRAGSTVGSWVKEMFTFFETVIAEEIKHSRSKISISFDGWGSKHDKISVLGVVAHFANSRYECVTRLIALPELPSHNKTGKGKSS